MTLRNLRDKAKKNLGLLRTKQLKPFWVKKSRATILNIYIYILLQTLYYTYCNNLKSAIDTEIDVIIILHYYYFFSLSKTESFFKIFNIQFNVETYVKMYLLFQVLYSGENITHPYQLCEIIFLCPVFKNLFFHISFYFITFSIINGLKVLLLIVKSVFNTPNSK